jgi:alpha-galactosidase
VLDVLRPEVRDHITGTIGRLLADHPGISYLKWDANRMITEPGSLALAPDRQANLWVDGPRALAAIARSIAEAHPDVELMLCASGGGRVDVDTLRSFHEVWLSDNTDPVTRVRMQYSASHVLPASVVGAHVTAWGARPVAFACAVALSGRFGFDLDLAALAPADLEVCRRAVDLHQRIRPLVQHGELWRLVDPATGDAAALAYHDPATGRAVLFAYQLDGPVRPAEVALPFLDPGTRYETATTDLTAEPRPSSLPAGASTLPWTAAGTPVTAAVTTFEPALPLR